MRVVFEMALRGIIFLSCGGCIRSHDGRTRFLKAIEVYGAFSLSFFDKVLEIKHLSSRLFGRVEKEQEE